MTATNGVAASNGVGKDWSSPQQDLAATAKVFQAIQGHWLSACLGVVMKLKVPEILTEAGEPLSFEKLAAKAGVTDAGHDHFYKVLRMLAQFEMLDESEGRTFAPSAATKLLVRVEGEEATLGHFVDHQINEPKWDAWKVLPEAVRTGEVAFALAHGGLDMHEYDEVEGHEKFADDFQMAMTYYTKQSLMGGDVELQDAYDWRSAKVIMDVGGGRGELLARCMLYAGHESKGVLFDRQWVLDSVNFKQTFESKGVLDAKQRLLRVSGDVREPFPAAVAEAKVDTLVMKHFLSGFSDADAKLILKHCKEVLPRHANILLLQTIVPEAGDRSHNTCKDGVAPGLFAIEILAQCPGGGWRTLSEWKTIFATAGYSLKDSKPVGSSMDMLIWQQDS
jgi:hypothetical protein